LKPKTKSPTPTALELEILEVVWRRGQATVREVYKDLSGSRKIAYTTVLTMMGFWSGKVTRRRKPGSGLTYIGLPGRGSASSAAC